MCPSHLILIVNLVSTAGFCGTIKEPFEGRVWNDSIWGGESDSLYAMMNASSVAPPFSREENTTEYNDIVYYDESENYKWYFCPLTAFCCLCGLVGNSKVIWLLSFCIKRNPFTTYILNLAVADFGTLLGLSARMILKLISIHYRLSYFAFVILFPLIYFTYSASLYLLTAISLERCLSVLFPIWYRCHRPVNTSAVVSSLLWIIPGFLSGILLLSEDYLSFESYIHVLNTIFTVNLMIFTPVMVASTLIMFIKICRSSQQRQPPRLYITILVTLLFFIIFAIPLSVINYCLIQSDLFSYPSYEISLLFASFNSSINPIIYYFVGRDSRKKRDSLKDVLKRAFRDKAMCQGGT